MGGMFQGTKATTLGSPFGWIKSSPIEAPVTPPPAPTMDNQQSGLDQMALLQARQLQAGRSATILNGGAGLASAGTTSKTLLGS